MVLTEAVRWAEAVTRDDCISAVWSKAGLFEVSESSLSALHPDLQRESAAFVVVPNIPSTGPGSKPAAFSLSWSSWISDLLRVFAEAVNLCACGSDAGAKIPLSAVAAS